MGIRKMTTLEVDGHAIEIAMTELIPARWSWTVNPTGWPPHLSHHLAASHGGRRPKPLRHRRMGPVHLGSINRAPDRRGGVPSSQ